MANNDESCACVLWELSYLVLHKIHPPVIVGCGMAVQLGPNVFQTDVNYFEVAMEYHRTRFLMNNSWFVALIVIGYVLFVKLIGPRLMKDRQPYDVKYLMVAYNLFQVFANVYILRECLAKDGVYYLKTMALYGIERKDNRYLLQAIPAVNMIMILKMIDLFDTVFMVLRKNFSQISFLHVYHHTMVVVTTYVLLRLEIGEYLVPAATINLTVHSIMYSYYCLSISKRLSQNYLHKYKIYITRMQLAQFMIICLQMVYLVLSDLPHPPILTWFVISQTVLFSILFANFYVKTYRKKETENKIK